MGMRRKSGYVCKLIFAISLVVFFCEFVIYYIIISQCSWPVLKEEQADSSIEVEPENAEAVKAMFIADIHLLGRINGQWFDKLRREWQMYRSFQTAITLFRPELVFILGDLFDEGLRCSNNEFYYYVKRLNTLFQVPENTKIFVVAGNHDVGFHYDISPHQHNRFVTELKAPPVQLISLRGNHFVLVNSMAMEGDGCFICRPAQIELNKIANNLRCAKGIGKCAFTKNYIKQYSRPIFIQHFPMYRDSDRQCSEPDQAPEDTKKQEFHERWDCLSREASELIYDNLKPRVIFGGHIHHGCHLIHRKDIHEYTLSSFNWRNKNNPSLILGVFSPNNYAVSKCYIPQESTIIFLYFLGCFFIILWILISFIPKNVYIRKSFKKYN